MHPIKETEEALLAINILSIYLIKQFKDGIQISDFMELYAKITSDKDFKAKMMEAYQGIQKIPEELKDLDLQEIIEITSLQLKFIPEIIDAIKK
jgi:hypothetical protein